MPKTPADAHTELKLHLCDATKSLKSRRDVLTALVTSNGRVEQAVIDDVLTAAANGKAESIYAEKSKELAAIINGIEAEGSQRSAVFLRMEQPINGLAPRAAVLLEDGNLAFVTVPYPKLAADMQPGQSLIIEAQGRMLIRVATSHPVVGDIAVFEKSISEFCIEVSLRTGQESMSVLTAPQVRAEIKAGRLVPGAKLLVNSRQKWAFAAADQDGKQRHFRFLDRQPLAVEPERVACPPRVILDVLDHVRAELTSEIHRKYSISRCLTRLLVGPSGCGKSFAIRVLLQRCHELMAAVCDCEISQLPRRVIWVNQSGLRSKWFGEAEANVSLLMQETEILADESFTVGNRQFSLPVFLVMEEIDGLARARTGEDSHNYAADSMLSSLLALLDPGRPALKNRFVVVLATTNVAHHLDAAMLRRLSGNIEYFGRLNNRQAFLAMFNTHVATLPAASNNGCTQAEIWRRHATDLAAWLFGPNSSDHGLVELSVAGSTVPQKRFRRDFLTAAIVARAVANAAAQAAKRELDGAPDDISGITLKQLIDAFEQQFQGLATTLRDSNVGQFCEIFDARVLSLRRVPQPSASAFEFMRPEPVAPALQDRP